MLYNSNGIKEHRYLQPASFTRAWITVQELLMTCVFRKPFCDACIEVCITWSRLLKSHTHEETCQSFRENMFFIKDTDLLITLHQTLPQCDYFL